MEEAPLVTIRSRTTIIAQIIMCGENACCCGRTDRDRPELPKEWLEATWRTRTLKKLMPITFSGCLGPCERPNVAVIVSGAGSVWLGGMGGEACYESLAAWAARCVESGRLVPLPAELERLRFERF